MSINVRSCSRMDSPLSTLSKWPASSCLSKAQPKAPSHPSPFLPLFLDPIFYQPELLSFELLPHASATPLLTLKPQVFLQARIVTSVLAVAGVMPGTDVVGGQ